MTTCEDSYYQRASEKASAALQNGSLSGRCTPELIPSSNHTEVFDSIGSPIFAVDKAGAISEWNRKLSALSGLSLSDVIRKPASLFIVDGFRPQWEGCLSQVLKGQATECVCEVSLFLSQGNNIRSSVLCRVRIAAQYDAAELPLELQSAAGAVCFIDGFQGQPAVASDDACADSTSSVTLDDELEGGIGALSLEATNGELAALLDTLRTPFFGIDAAGKVDAWNDRMSEATGYVQHEALGNAFVESFVDSYRREAVSSVFVRALEENGANNFELEFRGKDGELRFLLVNLCARLDDRRKPVGVVGVAQDVTEVSKHDRAVAAMASELRQLIDTANAPIFGIDCEGCVLECEEATSVVAAVGLTTATLFCRDVNEWNNTTAEITGYTKEEAFDCNLVDTFVLPSMRETVRGMFECALQGRGTSNFEIEFVTKSNEVRNLLVNATTRRDTEDCVVGVVAVAQDVTEAVQRDRAVAAMALELRQLIDTANAPIFGIDVNGNVNEWNRRTQEITGYSKEETFDEPLVERFIAPSMRQTVQRILDQALQGNETSNYELEFVTKSGESRFMLVNATTRRDPEFNIIGGTDSRKCRAPTQVPFLCVT
jgi:PAS domain S-box-containing protein